MKKISFILAVCLFLSLFIWAGDDARILRFPDVNKDLLVFVYAGDIWSVPVKGGEAKRLTSHKGFELFPKISPDGKWIAFSAEYSGSRQVYVMPSTGGIPKQLTFYNDVGVMPPRGGFDYQIMDWTPDSQKILFRGNRTPWGQRMGKYFLVDREGGLETPLQIPEAGGGTFSPDGKKMVYTPISREWRTWKRYKGGRAQDVWIYDLEKDESRRLTAFSGTDYHPIWYKDKIYFVSDRDLTLNLYAYDLNTDQIEKVTGHTDYDVLWPSGEGGFIAYENGGQVYVLDAEKGEAEKITVDVHFDNPNLLPYFKNVKDDISSFDISPSGKRAVFQARGEIFTLPAEEGITYNLSETPGQREIFPVWSPDGRYLAFYSDKTGEYEIYLMDKADGNKVMQLTEGSRIWRFPPVWSPDSTKLLFSDKNQKLQILDVKTKDITVADKARRFEEVRDKELFLFDNEKEFKATLKEAVEKGVINNEALAYYMFLTQEFLFTIGIDPNRFRFRKHAPDELAHYARECWDAEIYSERFGWIECVGIADRSAYDLSAHIKASGTDMYALRKYDEPKMVDVVKIVPKMNKLGPLFKDKAGKIKALLENMQAKEGKEVIVKLDGRDIIIPKDCYEIVHTKEKKNGERFVPHVIEPSYGIDRILYCVLEHSYYETEKKGEEYRLLKLKPRIAPIKVGVFPLVNDDRLISIAREVDKNLRDKGVATYYDDGGTIGRRYARMDEIGTPFCVTVDHQTIEDNTVTVRDRDTTKQVRKKIDELPNFFKEKLEGF